MTSARKVIRNLLTEAKRSPEMDTLKKHKKQLSDEEKELVRERGATWSDGSIGIWKSEVNGKMWYVSATHRAYSAKPTLRGAISAFDFIQSTS